MENDPKIKSLIDSKLLIDSELNELCDEIAEKSEIILNNIKSDKTDVPVYIKTCSDFINQESRADLASNNNWEEISKYYLDSYSFKQFFEKIESRSSEDLKIEFSNILNGINKRKKEKLIEISNQIQKKVGEFNQNRNQKLSILSNKIVYFCKECEGILPVNEFKPSIECDCGLEITKPEELDQIPIHYFNEKLKNFIKSNLWLEYGVDYF